MTARTLPPATADAGSRVWRAATLAPTVLVFVGLSLLPLANLVAMSVHDITWQRGEDTWRWVGAAHWLALPHDQLLRAGLRNTAVFMAAAVAVQMVLGFLLALLVVKVGRGTIYRTIFLIPILVPAIVIGAIWKLMYDFDFGIVNQLLALVGIPPASWLGSASTALAAVIVVDIWHWTPFVFLLMLAGLESLPQDVFEAARIDGAGPVQELFRVTLPLMAPTIVVTLLFRAIIAVKVFDEVYLLTDGGPGTATEVLSFTIFRRFFTEDRAGYGSAIAAATLCVLAVVVILALGAARRREHTQ